MTTREGIYLAGDYYLLCDICGFKKRRSECAKDWEGKIVCSDTCLDVRNPQDYIRIHPDRQNVVDVRYADPVFVDLYDGEQQILTEDSLDTLTEVPTQSEWLVV